MEAIPSVCLPNTAAQTTDSLSGTLCLWIPISSSSSRLNLPDKVLPHGDNTPDHTPALLSHCLARPYTCPSPAIPCSDTCCQTHSIHTSQRNLTVPSVISPTISSDTYPVSISVPSCTPVPYQSLPSCSLLSSLSPSIGMCLPLAKAIMRHSRPKYKDTDF